MISEASKSIFNRFLELHPNRQEAYQPTPSNVRRWAWHIAQIEGMERGEAVEYDSGPLSELKARRAVIAWVLFPAKAKSAYAKIGARFPGFQVYACGSRVRGDYVDGPGDEAAIKARAAAGKKAKERSDFDFWVEPSAIQWGNLPKFADRCRVRIPEHEKIAIPMWNFDKLPESEHAKVADLIRVGDWGKLAVIHDKYELSPYTYCCDAEGLKNWFLWALKEGKIKDGKN